jgi:hypothetical protein
MIVDMDGASVRVSLEKEPDGPLQQMTQGTELTPRLRRAVGWIDDNFLTKGTPPIRTLLTSWSDNTFVSGHFGVWGGGRDASSIGKESFRLFSLELES